MRTDQRRPPIDRWTEKTKRLENGCLLWTAHKDSWGYGVFFLPGPQPGIKIHIGAHKWIWEQKHGPVPDGLVLDHAICQFASCVEETHLEAVTQSVNVLRSDHHQRRKTHCPRRHEYTEGNTARTKTGGRECLTCRSQYYKLCQMRKNITDTWSPIIFPDAA